MKNLSAAAACCSASFAVHLQTEQIKKFLIKNGNFISNSIVTLATLLKSQKLPEKLRNTGGDPTSPLTRALVFFINSSVFLFSFHSTTTTTLSRSAVAQKNQNICLSEECVRTGESNFFLLFVIYRWLEDWKLFPCFVASLIEWTRMGARWDAILWLSF